MLAFAVYFSFHAHHHGVWRRKMSTPRLRVRDQVDRRMTITITRPSAMSFNAKILIYVIAGLLIVAASLVGRTLWFARTSASPPSGTPEPVTIAASNGYAGTCSIFAAAEKGYFANEGILLTIQPHTNGKAALDATLRGQANLATVGDVPVMFAAVSGQPVMVVATIFKAGKDYGIVGRKDSGIAAPESLKGKRVGVTLRTGGHFVLATFLNRQKLSASDVTMLNLKPEEFSAALLEGRIDAAATWEPFLGALLTQLGDNGVMFSSEGLYDGVFNLAGARDYVTSHPETIKKILRAVVRGGRFCKDAPDDARALAARVMKADATKLKAFWPSYRFDVTLDQSLLLALEDETRWAIKNKLTERTESINYLNHVYLDGLEAVSPAAVTLIH